MHNFTGQVVIVTGAGGNLGKSVAEAFLDHGAKLVLADRATGSLSQVYPTLANSNDHLLVESVDLTDEESAKNMVTETIRRFNQVNILVNTVGGYRAGEPIHETSLETWDFMFRLNARTLFLTCKAVIPHMLANGSGKIINIAARPGLKGNANMGAYSVSKGAVIRLTESMSAELKSKNINVNCIIPGTIDTPENREAMPNADFNKWVSPEHLANVILFLASPAANPIHGAAIPVYGLS